jgi:hypothetical protein
MYDSPSTTAEGGKKRKEKPWSHPDRKWEVQDAMHNIMRAEEHKKDKKLMAEVKKHAADHAQKMHEVSRKAAALAKGGHISPKQMAKLDKY